MRTANGDSRHLGPQIPHTMSKKKRVAGASLPRWYHPFYLVIVVHEAYSCDEAVVVSCWVSSCFAGHVGCFSSLGAQIHHLSFFGVLKITSLGGRFGYFLIFSVRGREGRVGGAGRVGFH